MSALRTIAVGLLLCLASLPGRAVPASPKLVPPHPSEGGPAEHAALPQPGDRFPILTLPSLADKPLSIADFRGRKVLLHQFASW